MSLAGLGVVAIWHDLLPDSKSNFYEWHNREHMPERTAIPGFRRGRRYIAVDGAPEYFNLYEADSAEVMSGPDYMNRLNNPSPWTKESVKAFRNVSRSVCRVAYSAGVGQGGAVCTLRFDIALPQRTSALQVLRRQLLPPLADAPGVLGVHLCVADEDASRLDTAEKRARNDATLVPAWIVLVEAINAATATAVGAQALADLEGLGVHSAQRSSYVLESARAKMPWSV